MDPVDLQELVEFLTLMLYDSFSGIGRAFNGLAAQPDAMHELTIGIFGEQGGLIYWCNEKLLWLMEQILEGLTFTSPLT